MTEIVEKLKSINPIPKVMAEKVMILGKFLNVFREARKKGSC